ncbi:DUF4247 domain-containing protein [Mycobacterium celatum]|uniref:DUF4247 domain-containing protein n=1 Tax=Mycobacterium celatum TaxID=28045 RepID=A0A1X1RTS8_MYCCE|nr:DUF4247 domain-containing protein [Mycobacterium celatum]ORV15441.1 hypothetical protein AWB95_07840 [Mycobacterium celatum]PIB77395.1 DUF4247 domain-containing protein [Mycobacterium celatum]
MSRNRLFVMALALAVTSVISLIFGITLLHKDIRTYIAGHYHEYSRDANGTRYLCEGSPARVANTLGEYQHPAAQAANAGTQYLRYDNEIVTVGPDSGHPCSIRVEDLAAGYNHGAFIFLGPGFYPGAPRSGSGGSSGGPGGTK